MNAEILYIKKFKGLGEWEYKDSGVFYCSQCQKVYNQDFLAEECCKVKKCSCGKDCEKYYFSCPECIRNKKIQEGKDKFSRAEKLDIKDYEGYLLDGEYAYDDYKMYFDNYFENQCDFSCPICKEETKSKGSVSNNILGYLECQNKECNWKSPEFEVIDEIYYLFAPEYIWATDFRPVEIDISRILEDTFEEHHESVYDYYKGGEELKIAINKFNEINKNVGSYNESNKLALINIKEFVKEMYKK